jgi:hypothetical protein
MAAPDKKYEHPPPQDIPLLEVISTTELTTQSKKKLDPNITHTARS